MLLLLLKITGLLLATITIAMLMRRTSAGARHQVWLVALAALLVLPALARWSPLPLRVLPAQMLTPQLLLPQPSDAAQAPTTPASERSLPVAPNSSRENTQAPVSAPSSLPSLGTVLLIVWAAVMLLLFGWLMNGWHAVRRIVSRADLLEQPEWQGPLYEIADRLGLSQAPRLVRSSDVHMPFACGLLHSTIVLPAESDRWTPEQRTAVLIHELGHVRRRDLIGHTLGRVACAVYWFHPLVWTAARRLRDESERACDDLALQFGARPSEYAEHLLTIVTSVRNHRTPSIALAMAHRREFEGRMLAILDPQLRRVGPSRGQSIAVMSLLTALCLVVSAAAPAPRVQSPRSGKTEALLGDTSATAKMELRHGDSMQMQTKVATNVNTAVRQSRPTPAPAPAAKANLAALPETVLPQGTDDERTAMLIKLLRTDSSASVRRVAAWGLQRYVEAADVPAALIRALSSDSDDRVRQMAAWALESADGDVGASALMTALERDKSDGVRETAVWAMGERNLKVAAPLIGRLLSTETSDWVRSTMAWSLGSMGLHTAPKGLIDAVGDKAADVRYKAAWALSQIGDRAALPALNKAIATESADQAVKAMLRALLSSGEAPADLSKLLSSGNPEIRAVATRALAGDMSPSPWPWPWPRPMPNP